MNEILGNNIMKLRKENGLTQEQLANALGISYQAVSKWETANSCPDIATLPLLADLFSVSIDELFGRPAPGTRTAPVPTAAEEEEEASPTRGELPWPDDDTFYAVLYHGHELIGSQPGRRGAKQSFCFQYEGPAQNVSCDYDLQVTGTICGSVDAGGDVTCDDVYGDVSAGGDVTCDEVTGNVSAGGDVTCDEVTGNVSAGGDVTCGEVGGAAFAGDGFHSDELDLEMDELGDRLSESLSGLGDRIAEAVNKNLKKNWSFHKKWPFGGHTVEVDLDLQTDDDERE